VREHTFLSQVRLIGAIAILALVANAILNNRIPGAWIFAIAIFGTIGIAGAIIAATHRSTRRH
jgi:hypothetical protein